MSAGSRALGVCYYPEHWPEETWPEDARRMAEAGLAWVRIGEFAWSRLEPRPGDLRWDWLDRAVDTLGAAGLRVVLGTPTATPPRWMLDRHPDMLAHDAGGRPRGFGSRRHYDFSHPGYRDEAVRIARLLGERYGRHPHVHAWQIDNEYDCHDTAVSYSPAAARAFRAWCEARYGTVEALNEAWGTVFWSMEYDDWRQIDPPHLTVTEPHPAHVLAFRRFSSDQVVRFDRAQVDALRPLTDAPLIHNYMGFVTGFDHWALGRDLDVAAWDSYPLGFLSDRIDAPPERKARYLRQGDPDMQAFHHDLYRGVGRGRLWIMEQQPGPVNWAPWNPAPLPGMVRLWAWEAFAHGAEVVSYFRWRQAPFGQEQHHAGLLRPDAEPAPALAEIAQVAREIAELDAADDAEDPGADADRGPGTPEPGSLRASASVGGEDAAPAALVFDYASAWMWEIQPQGADFDYLHLCLAFYRGLRRLGLSVDVVPPDADVGPYRLVLAPGLATLPEGLRGRARRHDRRTPGRGADGRVPHPRSPAPGDPGPRLHRGPVRKPAARRRPPRGRRGRGPPLARGARGLGRRRAAPARRARADDARRGPALPRRLARRRGAPWHPRTGLRGGGDRCARPAPRGARARRGRPSLLVQLRPRARDGARRPPAARRRPPGGSGVRYGATAGGEAVHRVVLGAGDLAVAVLTHGARLQDVRLRGEPLTLGTDALAPYEGPMASFGALVAPVVGRIAGAQAPLDGRVVELEANDRGLTRHSASAGTHRKVWALDDAGPDHAALSITLPDGEAGFPGRRRVTARYEVEAPATLTMTVEARTDAPTWINVANHAYWRLGGEGIADHRLRVAADRYLPAEPSGLPTGEVAPVAGPFDLREGRTLGREPDYDHNVCLSSGRRPLTPVAWLEGPSARLEVSTTEPGLQVYTGQKLRDVGVAGHDGRLFHPRAGIALEAQGWPDAPNHADWPSVRLDPGEVYRQVTRWRFAPIPD